MQAVVTVTGTDRRGIIASVSGFLYEHNVNIVDISQTVLGKQFDMIMIVDLTECSVSFLELSEGLETMGKDIGMIVRLQHEDIFNAMYNV